jgi:hypothetical protein
MSIDRASTAITPSKDCQAQIDDAGQSGATGDAHFGREDGVTQRQRDQRRIQMQIGGMNKTERHL